MNAVQVIASQAACFLHDSCQFREEEEMEHTPESILKDVFGYSTFRPLQRAVIQNVLDGRDTLAVMPTGGGKSLCYQIPALMMPGLTVVVSPLIALMQDQVSQLTAAGVSAAFLNSTVDFDTWRDTARAVQQGQTKILYVSPEGLNTQRMTDLLHSPGVIVSCITIDEAHCISEWGHDFRPDYLEIAALREQFSGAVCLALTATATQAVRDDITRLLRFDHPAVLISSFNRGNLFLEVRRRTDADQQVLQFVREHDGESGIVYCFSRKQVDELTGTLSHAGIRALNYHAGLSDQERADHQARFIRGMADVMVATVAFGMGINKPDVRFVIHYSLPKSIEQYYQEIGRAGRDGQSAHALLLYSPADIRKIRYFFDESSDSQKAESLLQKMVSYAEGHVCRRRTLLSYFGEAAQPQECCCDVCERGTDWGEDVTIQAQKFMSCVLRTRERYGASYIADILLGSRSRRIMENGHQRLSTWGIGSELAKSDWMELSSELVGAGYLFKSEDYGVLYVTEAGHEALGSRSTIQLPVQFDVTRTARQRPAAKPRAEALPHDDAEGQRIAQELKAWRRSMADELNVPPYVVFGDKTLQDIAAKKPASQSQLCECYGIGATKAERFGSAILRIVRGDA